MSDLTTKQKQKHERTKVCFGFVVFFVVRSSKVRPFFLCFALFLLLLQIAAVGGYQRAPKNNNARTQDRKRNMHLRQATGKTV